MPFPAWEFAVGQGRGVAALSGVGEAAARRAAAQLLAVSRPQVFLSLGFAGALTPEVQPGAVILGNAVWHYSPENGALQEVARLRAPQPAAGLAERLAAAGIPALCGNIVTSPVILAKERQSQAFRHLANPVLDQETGAAAEVAAAHGVAFLGMRGVTDAAGEEIPDFMVEALNARRTPGPGMALGWLVRDPRRVAQLIHFWRRSNRAARNLARALRALLPLIGTSFGQRLHDEM